MTPDIFNSSRQLMYLYSVISTVMPVSRAMKVTTGFVTPMPINRIPRGMVTTVPKPTDDCRNTPNRITRKNNTSTMLRPLPRMTGLNMRFHYMRKGRRCQFFLFSGCSFSLPPCALPRILVYFL